MKYLLLGGMLALSASTWAAEVPKHLKPNPVATSAKTLPSTSAKKLGVSLGKHTLYIGDSMERMYEVAGKPNKTQPFAPNSPYMRHDYDLKDGTVIVSTKDGKVTGIADNRLIRYTHKP